MSRCLSSLELRRETADRTAFRGSILAPATLAGPPARLHGGLHAAVRLLLPLERLVGDRAAETPVAMEVRMRRGIPLLEEVSIEGSIESSADGAIVLRTRVDGTDRLDAELRAPADDTSREVLARFRGLVDEDRRAGEPTTVRGNGNLEVSVGARLVSLRVDEAFASRSEIHHVRFFGPNQTVDPTFTSVALDVIGAYALGTTLETRLFTTHLSLTVGGSAPLTSGGFLVLGDRRPTEVPNSTIPKVEVRGEAVGEQRVEVLLADATLERAFGYGFVSLVPQRIAEGR